MARDRRAYCAELERRNPHLADLLWHAAEPGERRSPRQTALAISICRSCPLRLDCLAEAITGGYDDESIYGGMGRRERHRLAILMEEAGFEPRRRDGSDPVRRHRECLDWLRGNPEVVRRVSDTTAYWREDWRRRKARAASPSG